MALPTSDRPAPAPSAATVKRKKGTGGTPSQIFDDALLSAAPTTTADDRRTQAPLPPPPPAPPVAAATYRADWDQPPPTTSMADDRRVQPTLLEAILRLSPETDNPRRVRSEERRQPLAMPTTYADDLRGANARAPRGTPSADDRRAQIERDLVSSTADDRRQPTARGLADAEVLGPPVPKGKGVKLENIPAPPSRRSGKRGGEGDTAKRSSRVQRTPYDPATLRKAYAVLAAARAREDEGIIQGGPLVGYGPNIDLDLVPGDASDYLPGGEGIGLPSIDLGWRGGSSLRPGRPTIDISGGNLPSEDNAPISVEEAQKIVDVAERAQRAHAIGADVVNAKPIPIHKQVDRMTWDEYNALSPRERAAVDSNAQVVNAVRTDRQNQETYGAPTDQYNATVEKLFGADGGSETFAPAVVSYLDSIGFHDEAADLDDFLNLNAAIREQDLKHLDPTRGPVDTSKMSDVRLDRLGLATELSERTLASVDDVMRHGEQLKATFAASAKADRGDLTVNLGGVAPKTRSMVGFGEHGAPVNQGGKGVTLDGYFQDLFTRLADKSQGPKRVQGDLAAVMANPDFDFTQEQANQFWEYVEARTAEALRYGQSLGVAGENLFTPEELRSVLNMERINSGGQA